MSDQLSDADLVAIGANVAVEGLAAEIEQLRQQVSALTTENANLASLVEEQRAALEKALKLLHGVKEFPHDLTIYGPGGINVERVRSVSAQLSAILVRTPEQAGARRRAERLVIDLAIGYVNGVVERHKLREAVDVLTEVVRKETGHAGCFQ